MLRAPTRNPGTGAPGTIDVNTVGLTILTRNRCTRSTTRTGARWSWRASCPRAASARATSTSRPREGTSDWYFIAEQPAPAPRLANPEGYAALRIVLVTVPRVSRSCEHFPDIFDLHLLHGKVPRAASERRGDNLKGVMDFYLKAKVGIWP